MLYETVGKFRLKAAPGFVVFAGLLLGQAQESTVKNPTAQTPTAQTPTAQTPTLRTQSNEIFVPALVKDK